jgi:hypothetical protein
LSLRLVNDAQNAITETYSITNLQYMCSLQSLSEENNNSLRKWYTNNHDVPKPPEGGINMGSMRDILRTNSPEEGINNDLMRDILDDRA